MFKSRLHSFEFAGAETPRVFLTSKQGMYTYSDLRRFCGFFSDITRAGDDENRPLVGFLAESCDELVFAIAACWQLGIPFVPINPSVTDAELEEYLQQLKPDLLFTDTANRHRISGSACIAMDENFLLNAFTHDVRNFELPDPEQFEDDDIFGYFFTSGTTSKPKTVPLKRRQMKVAAEASSHNFRPEQDKYWLLCLPLNHIGGISIILRTLLYGSAIYRMGHFNELMIKEFLGENSRFQAASLVPTMLKRLLDDPLFKTHREFKSILLGGGPVTGLLLKKSAERGIPVVSSYGMTETCAQIMANPLLAPSGMYTPLKSVGKPFPPNRMEIRNEDRQALGKNQSGQIWLKGPQVFDGYLNEEDNEGKFDQEGWFNTGDYGHMNGFGHIFIESRRTDLIISGGENINPGEIEVELLRIQTIKEAAVIGVPDEEWGQKVAAIITLKNGKSPELDDIRQQLGDRLSSYKLPRELRIVDKLPKTPTGKIRKWKLLELFTGR